ncbi:MAG: Tetratricopeptide repeat-containing protein [Chitinophagaceae bacterium]|nr:Tetratricopeptide repeat-containing protein [Chitinophagaceae bacterium]
MKKIIFILFILTGSFSFAQRIKIDSILKLIAFPKNDTTTAKYYNRLSNYYNNKASDSALFYSNKGLALSQKLHWLPGEARSLTEQYRYYYRKENHPKALSLALTALRRYEELKDTAGMIGCLIYIGDLYSGEEDYERAITYAKQAYLFARLTKNNLMTEITAHNIGSGYASLKVADSALIYLQESYVYATQDTSYLKKIGFAFAFRGLGRAQLLLKNYTLALSYFQVSLSHALNSPRDQARDLLPEIQWYLSHTFNLTGQTDSALIYAEKSLVSANETTRSVFKLKARSLLAELYMGKDNDKAVQYFKLASDLRDSLFTSKRKAEMSALTVNEAERQNEILQQKQSELKERKNNLQYAAIVIALIAFIILFLLLSRSIMVKTNFIEFFSVLGLLAVFEFINLLIHPYLAHATNDSPVLMLLVLIAIGALLIPLHHKLEKWITKIMVEKNKKIRLEAARKTIEQLEGQN